MSMAGLCDPTRPGRLPIVLSDALLGRDPKEIFTAIKYNHKPTLSSPAAPSKARLKPEGSSDDGYDLSFRDDGGQYAYQGTRTADDNKYVLIYDPAREVLVLHKVDSTFNMNITQTPDNNNPESLARKYPPLEGSRPTGSSRNTNTKKTAPTTSAKPKPTQKKGRDLAFPPPKAKPAKQPQATQSSSSSAAKQNRATATTPDSEDEESSDDDILQIEDSGGRNAPPASARDFSPAFGVRRFSDFVQQNTEEEDDADGEDDDDNQSIEHFTLPSPVNRQMEESAGLHREASDHDTRTYHHAKEDEEEESDEDADAEMEDVGQPAAAESGDVDMDEEEADLDLEAELMAAFEEEAQDQAESDVSEEE